MKAMVLEKYRAPLALRERDLPELAPDEVLVKVGAAGLCGTDLKLWHGVHPACAMIKLPAILGHECAGEVAAVGSAVEKHLIGKHAVIFFYLSCGVCAQCCAGRDTQCVKGRGQLGFTMPGSFAEYVKVPAGNLYFIRPDIPFSEAAIITDAIATPYRALTNVARVQSGETVLVLGAGGLGIHALQIAKALHAKALVADIKDKALELAKQLGADGIFHGGSADLKKEILEVSHGGVDVVLDYVGRKELQQMAIELLLAGGRFVSQAYSLDNFLPVTSANLVRTEIQLLGSRACSRQNLKETIELVESGKVKPVIHASYPLTEANTALEKLEIDDLIGRSVLLP